jgi:catechol 2,3-dioxygenase-like lactoylglutathione lyase family enzyme
LVGATAPRELQAFAAVFTVGDVGAGIAFYVERLGFRIHFRMDDPPDYAIVERDAVSLHLMPAERAPASRGQSSIYVFVADVDRLHAEMKGRGAAIETAPTDYAYGMREMSVRDPDGNRITFGREVSSRPS